MVALILCPDLEQEIIQQRQEWGVDKWDEVWDGVYVIPPPVDNQHQLLMSELIALFHPLLDDKTSHIFAGVNVSDRVDWTSSYRCPDFAIYLEDNPAEDHDAFMLGGPDLAIEIISPNDRTREKIDFYAKVNTRELLIIDRDPWKFELYQLRNGILELIAETSLDGPAFLTKTLSLTWQLVAGKDRPKMKVQSPSGQNWLI